MFAFTFFILTLLSNSNLAFVSGQSDNELLLDLRNNLTYDSFVSTKLLHWNESLHYCRWPGVECDDQGRVSGLDLTGESIYDGINGPHNALFRLKHLQSLSLAQNGFESVEFPYGFGQLTELRYLNLSGSGFFGQVPSDLSNLTRLVSLDLSYKSVSSLSLPDLRTLIHNLTSLREVYLDGVNVSATGNEWGSAISSYLPNLRVLSMPNSYLTGPFHPSLQKLQSLSHIRLDNNNFSSPFPEFFSEFPELEVLTLSSCELSGVVPAKLFQIKTLQSVVLDGNDELGGSFPDFPMDGSLQQLVIGGARFSGTLPDSIGNLGMLSELSVVGSNISGPIPSTIKNLTQLAVLNLGRNNLSGSVPSFALMKNLTTLVLAGNRLTGPLPDSLWKGLDNLVSLDLSENSLEGGIPASLFLLPALETLLLANNRFSVMTEPSMNALSRIQTLDLSSNRIEGSIPRMLLELRNLSTLDLSSNKFSGSIDLADFKNLTDLNSLDLSYNNLSIHVNEDASSPSLPPKLWILKLASCKMQKLPFLGNHSLLAMLDLSDNGLDGEIPSWMWDVGDGSLRFLNLSHNHFTHLQQPYNLQRLQYLNLHANKLRGQIPAPLSSSVIVDFSSNNFSSIPTDIGNLLGPSMMFFSAADNVISRPIPLSFCNASSLDVLDLSNNRFRGEIPPCLLNNTLRVLNLRRNNLVGEIPDSFAVGCSLETLDLSRNVLQGEVPESLSRCSELEVLDLTNNMLNATLPCWLNTLPKLRVVVLRANMFHGSMTCLGDGESSWPNLQIIDFASNNVTGVIPTNFLRKLQALMSDGRQEFDHLNFSMQTVLGLYYQDSMTVTMKGQMYELEKIQTIFTSIDFSDNNLQGGIPATIGELKSLYLLNFSHNSLSGDIPSTIGDLKKLQSLDLSFNSLGGRIPTQLAELTFLGVLNLSYNHLVGMIPRGTQLDGFEETSFAGNDGLCGLPVNRSCGDGGAPPAFVQGGGEGEMEHLEREIYVCVGLGFVVGLGFIVAPLVFCKRWRRCYDKHLTRIMLWVLHRQNHPNEW